jgi:hypothetical protein
MQPEHKRLRSKASDLHAKLTNLDLDKRVAAVAQKNLLLAIVDAHDSKQEMARSAESQGSRGVDDEVASLDDI